MNIPNILTIMRFILVPFYVIVFFSDIKHGVIYATGIFILAGITDVLDGYIARKYNMVTKLGIALDPLADKTMVMTVVLCMYLKGYLPIWVLAFVLAKEFSMICGGLLLFWKMDKTVIPANKYGKLSTFTFYVAIFIVVLDISSYLNYTMISIAVFIALLAFCNYLIGFKKIKKNNKLNVDKL